MIIRFFSAVLVFLFFNIVQSQAQCNSLRPQRVIAFDTDQDCAPVEVTEFTITYFFNASQNPADIEIRFEWNDPGNQISIINIGNGLIAANGDTEFTATAPSFTYFDNDGQCTILPTAYIYINGVLCPSSEQVQPAFFWGTDEQANANLFINPVNYDVCFNNPINNAIFIDNSEFNCNINVEPDNPNRQARHVQFVYGTNHDPSTTILNLSLEDGGTQPLTDGTGNLVSPQTRGAILPVTGAYFGPVDAIPFPADDPVSISFPMNAPADLANLIGHDFEITLFNWNICNPYNGDPLNPNYEDAISTTAYIVIVDSPEPDFITRRGDANGAVATTFCLGEDIYFDNETPNIGGLDFDWEFYDDPTGINLIGTSTNNNPIFAFNNPGQKLIRLTATDPTAQGACVEVYEAFVEITPSLVAAIGLSDFNGDPINPLFCQDTNAPLNFEVRFSDISVGTPTANTRWRWEFYDENNVLIFEDPPAGTYSTTPLGPYDRFFTDPGMYRAVLIIRDEITTCESQAEEFVVVYPNPVANFTANAVCEGEDVNFIDTSSLAAINGETIVSWEWDFDYDGVTFNKDAAFDNQTNFMRSYATAGSFDVALRVVTDQNSCEDLFVQTVTTHPNPVAQIIPDVIEGCSVLTVNFSNDLINAQPDIIEEYIWEIDDGTGYTVVALQDPTAPDFTPTLTYDFENNTQVDLLYQVRMRAVTVNGCEAVSNEVLITVFPGPLSGFNSVDYAPFNDNCSPLAVAFQVDNATQAQNPTNYEWTITDNEGLVAQQSTGTSPVFDFVFENDTQSFKDFQVNLTTSLPGNCNSDSTITIRVNPIPEAAFEIDTLVNDCEVMRLAFEASQKGMAVYQWQILVNGNLMLSANDLGDRIEYEVNKVNAILTVEARLRTTNFAGCESGLVSRAVEVEEKQVINAAFTASPTNQTLPEATVTLTNNTNTGPWAYLWDFGDGTTSILQNPTPHTYAEAGTFTITLAASNGSCSSVAVQSVTINPTPPIPPIADFDYNPAFGCAPLTVSFTNLSQFADNDSYQWDFGDNQGTSTMVNPTYTYFEPGVYTVSLTAANSVGQTDTEVKTDIITVYESPIAIFDVRPTIVFVPDNPIYTNNNSQNATSFLWDFGDGNTSIEAEPIYYYKEEGEFDITLIASNAAGCTDTLTRVGVVQGQQNGRLLVPNAFSPNLNGPSGGDINNQTGTNDVFQPLTQSVAEFEMFIFNRWGEMLFKSMDKNIGWDGYYNGKLCPQDVYVYKLNLVFENGQKITRSGDVNLIR